MQETLYCHRCGSSNYVTAPSGKHLKASCADCGRYIKFISQNNPVKDIPFGKYKGRELASMTSREEVEYLKWALENMDRLKGSLRQSIIDHLQSL